MIGCILLGFPLGSALGFAWGNGWVLLASMRVCTPAGASLFILGFSYGLSLFVLLQLSLLPNIPT